MTYQPGDDPLRYYYDLKAQYAQQPQAPAPQPVQLSARSANPLRPHRFADVIGQQAAKDLMQAAIASCKRRDEPLPHTLLIGQAGTGKSTFANVIGEEMGVSVYQSSAPVSYDMLIQLRDVMRDRDILFVDEIHMQAVIERRGKESISQPEQFLHLMEDRVIVTPAGPVPYPAITVVGATTDPGRLPEAFLSRFTLRPRLVEYDNLELAVIAIHNADALGMNPTAEGAARTAMASGGIPRQVNNLVRQAQMFGDTLDSPTIQKVLDATGITDDGLDPQQQETLRFLLRFGGQKPAKGDEFYQASIGSIATALGLSRDVKAVQLYVEPLLIKRGLIQVRPQGRRLTDLGIKRAGRL